MRGVINPEEWAKVPGRWHGEFEGGGFGAGISVIFFSKPQIGAGPRLHQHPYPETFIIRSGRALFTVADEVIEAHAGQILFVPAFTPHKLRKFLLPYVSVSVRADTVCVLRELSRMGLGYTRGVVGMFVKA